MRLVLMLFYAPAQAMREVRDRGALAPTGLVALLAHALFFFALSWFYLGHLVNPGQPLAIVFVLFQSAGSLVIIALVFCPLTLFLANIFERRASFRLLLQQEYAALAATMFYALTAASLITTILTIVGRLTGVQRALSGRMLDVVMEQRSQVNPEVLAAIEQGILTPELIAAGLSVMVLAAVFAVWAVLALRTVFRLSWFRAVIVVLVSGTLLLPAYKLMPIVGTILASPFLLVMVFLLLRGYVGEFTRTQRARESFRQNLEAATLNPADASAHYNLGLIHQQRGELELARERFERALQIDDDEVDAHYQLGRIAREQKRYADAVRHFEQVVSRDRSHAQNEVWREVGATYLAAGQFEDARNALEPFLDHRPSDPEALYLMGRAHAGMGHQREAASSMQACIEAVKTAPAYKYRADKRWLNEAQQFLRTQAGA
ncbi:MAG: tetratricopeptide repeat protein [Pyrinomonadaceae bacterium]|nr:tetratricopeptide repeat protein [Pyrinomonadaceae bacterium]